MTQSQLSSSAQRVQNVLEALGMTLQVVELPASTRTAKEAAQAVGASVDQIIKSLIFRAKRSGRPILVLASGKNRVDERIIEELIGEPLGRANPDFVRESTGFAIGGVPPVGHPAPIETFIDRDLLAFDELWAAAGTPYAVFCLSSADLVKIAPGKVIRVN